MQLTYRAAPEGGTQYLLDGDLVYFAHAGEDAVSFSVIRAIRARHQELFIDDCAEIWRARLAQTGDCDRDELIIRYAVSRMVPNLPIDPILHSGIVKVSVDVILREWREGKRA